MASERYSFSLTTFSPRYFEMSNTFLWKGGIYFESVEIKTQHPQEPHPLNPQNCAPYLSNCGELVQIECSAKNMKLVCHDHACILAFGSSQYEIVCLLLKHNSHKSPQRKTSSDRVCSTSSLLGSPFCGNKGDQCG